MDLRIFNKRGSASFQIGSLRLSVSWEKPTSRVLFFIVPLVFCILDSNRARSQTGLRRIDEYTYTVKCSAKIYRREFLSDTVFIEKTFDRIDPVTADSIFIAIDTFKVKDGSWWYLLEGKYYPFFSKEMFAKGEVTARHYNAYDCIGYLPLRTEQVENRTIYVFKVNYNGCRRENFDQVDIAYFYFDPDIGFIKRAIWMCGTSNLVVIHDGK